MTTAECSSADALKGYPDRMTLMVPPLPMDEAFLPAVRRDFFIGRVGEAVRVGIIAPAESPDGFTQEMWTRWLTKYIPGFGDLDSIPQMSGLSDEERVWIKERIQKNAGRCMRESIDGIQHVTNDVSSRYPSVSSQLVFTKIDFIDTFPSLLFTTTGSNFIFVNTRTLEQLSLVPLDQIYPFVRGTDNVPVHMTTVPKTYKLISMEEKLHIFDKHKYQLTVPDNYTSVSAYDAYPHELHALRYITHYVETHPDEFPRPAPDAPGELEILRERIQQAEKVIEQSRNGIRHQTIYPV